MFVQYSGSYNLLIVFDIVNFLSTLGNLENLSFSHTHTTYFPSYGFPLYLNLLILALKIFSISGKIYPKFCFLVLYTFQIPPLNIYICLKKPGNLSISCFFKLHTLEMVVFHSFHMVFFLNIEYIVFSYTILSKLCFHNI